MAITRDLSMATLSANRQKLDDISGSFDGANTDFTLTVSSTQITPSSPNHLIISLNGVVQEPTTTYNVTGSTISFTTPPPASATFFGIHAESLTTGNPGTPADGSVGTAQLSTANVAFDTSTLFIDSTNNRVGVGTITPSTALDVSGNITVSGEIRGPSVLVIDPAVVSDNTGLVIIKGDLQIDGTTTTINSTTLEIDDKNIILAANSVNAAAADGAGITVDGASATLTYVNSTDSWAFNKNLTLGDNIATYFGASQDLQIYHDGSASVIKDAGTGDLRLLGDNLKLARADNSVNYLHCTAGGQVQIYYNGSVKLATTSTGIDVTGGVSIDDDNNFSFGDGTTYIQGSGAADRLKFITNASEAMRIDSSGNVGIGTDSPDNKLHIFAGSAGAVTGNAVSPLIIENSTHVGINFLSPNTSENNIYFGDVDEPTQGVIRYRHNGDSMSFHTAATERMRIHSSGNVSIGSTIENGKLSLNQSDLPFMTLLRNNTTKTYFGVGNGTSLSGVAAAGDTVLRAEQKLLLRSGGDTNGITLNSSGLVGVHTTSPFSPLNVAKAGINTGTITFDDETNNAHLTLVGTDARVRLQMGTYNNDSYAAWIQASYDNNSSGTGNSGIEPLVLNPQGGNVGIGTTSPTGKLAVASTGNTGSSLEAYSVTDSIIPDFQLLKSGSASIGTLSTTASGEALGQIRFTGVDTANNQRDGAKISVYQDSAATSGTVPAGIRFDTNLSERMRIDSSGKVLINSTNPYDDRSMLQVWHAMARLGNIMAGKVDGSGNNNSAAILVHKMGQGQGFQFSGKFIINSWTGNRNIDCHVTAYYTNDSVSFATNHTNASIATTTVRLCTISYGGYSWLAFVKDGGGTGVAYLNAFVEGNIHIQGGIREITSGYTVTTTHTTF